MSVPALVDRVAELQAALRIVSERAPEAILIEFANLLLAFEANGANGSGALYFNVGQGHAHDWGVRSEVTVHRPLTRASRKRSIPIT